MGIAKLNLNQLIVGSPATIILFPVLFQLTVLEMQCIYSMLCTYSIQNPYKASVSSSKLWTEV